MNNALLVLMLIVSILSMVVVILIWLKMRQPAALNLDKALRDELRISRDDASKQARELREEVATAQGKANELLVKTVNTLGDDQKALLDKLTRTTAESATATRGEIEKLVQRTAEGLKEIQTTTETRLESVRLGTEAKLQASQESSTRQSTEMILKIQELTDSGRKEMTEQREKLDAQLKGIQRDSTEQLDKIRGTLEERLGLTVESQRKGFESFAVTVTALTDTTKTEFTTQRDRLQAQLQEIQKANENRFDMVRRTLDEKLRQVLDDQKKHLLEVVTALKGLEKVQQEEQQKARESLDQKFRQIQESNEKKLDEMRQTVDEKLHKTLETRLGESFKLVSERLEAVQNGLGEMKTLATGVGDLKRVLTNVKDRGTWGEYQLEAILLELLTPDQFGRNVQPKEGGERVEFALKLPGRGGDDGKPVWLPLDSKFPKEDYERLSAAAEKGDAEGVKEATKMLVGEILRCAKDIHDKYISPPDTTDFAIMFLPTEGLYAEVLRQPGMHDELRRKYHVLAAGPTTLSAILNSLRIGFQTLSIEKRASEVWNILSAVKTEFGKFGDVLDKVKKQLHSATTTLDKTGARSRAIERRLRTVDQLPAAQAQEVLAINPADIIEAEEVAEVEEKEEEKG